MKRSALIGSVVAWLALWAFWLLLTRDSHPTFLLALIVTTSLIVAYAMVAYIQHLYLIPHYWKQNRRGRYAGLLLALMLVLNALALTVIRVSYFQLWGPDADPYGAYKHFAIDLFGMVVHLLLAACAIRIWKRYL